MGAKSLLPNLNFFIKNFSDPSPFCSVFSFLLTLAFNRRLEAAFSLYLPWHLEAAFSLLVTLAFNCCLEAADQERREQGGGGRGSEGAGQIPVHDREGEAGVQHGRE
jgi:hypothetical protein